MRRHHAASFARSSAEGRVDVRAVRAAVVGRLLKAASSEWLLLTLGIIALLASAGVNLFIPFALQQVVEEGLGSPAATDGSASDSAAASEAGPTTASIIRTCAIFFGIFCVGALFTFVRGVAFSYAGERVVARLRTKLFAAVINQDMAFFDASRTGELLSRLSADTALVQVATTVTFPLMCKFFLQFTGGTVALLIISWRLTLVMIAPIPILGAFAGLYGRAMKKLSGKVQNSLAVCSERAEESISLIRFVRSFGKEDEEIRKYSEAVATTRAYGLSMSWLYGTFQAGAEFASYISIVLVVGYGASLLLRGLLELPALLSYLLFTVTVAHALGAFSHQGGDFVKALGATGRVFELIDRAPAVLTSGGKKLPSFDGRVEFDNVCFRYPSRPEAEVLTDVSLTLEPGKVMALVGSSGSGKTTIMQLVLRLYDAEKGVVRIGGTDAKDLDARWLRDSIGFVTQEPVLFAASLRSNIAYGRAEASQDDIEAAARAAYIHDFISSLPQGYDTVVGERGVSLSGGQLQRVAIARAILKDPPLLLFDEATSALDSESEHLVQKALDDICQNRAVLVIAHRLSTIRNADEIVVLDAGRVAERGTHDDLLDDPESAYSRLVNRQKNGGLKSGSASGGSNGAGSDRAVASVRRRHGRRNGSSSNSNSGRDSGSSSHSSSGRGRKSVSSSLMSSSSR